MPEHQKCYQCSNPATTTFETANDGIIRICEHCRRKLLIKYRGVPRFDLRQMGTPEMYNNVHFTDDNVEE